MSTAGQTTVSDGRVARRERNRAAVLDAVIELFSRGNADPAVEEVSALSGVSTRSVYRYFHHRDELIRAAMEHLMIRIEPEMRLAGVGCGPLDARIERFVDHRLAVFAVLAPLTRAAQRAAQTVEVAGQEFEASQLALRSQLAEHFAPEFAPLGALERTRAVIVAELTFQFDSFEYLHTSLDGNTDEMRVLLVRQLKQHFGSLR